MRKNHYLFYNLPIRATCFANKSWLSNFGWINFNAWITESSFTSEKQYKMTYNKKEKHMLLNKKSKKDPLYIHLVKPYHRKYLRRFSSLWPLLSENLWGLRLWRYCPIWIWPRLFCNQNSYTQESVQLSSSFLHFNSFLECSQLFVIKRNAKMRNS